MNFLLSIDQGTTNSRAIIFNANGNVISQHEIPLQQSYPQEGWVEQNPEEMFSNTVACVRSALQKSSLTAKQIAAIGIANQRETTIIWHKDTGQAIYPAIVWQDRRTVPICENLVKQKLDVLFQENTGLRLDPYFSATKIMWILEHIPDARRQAENGKLLFGTVDSYLLWKLTRGQSHFTDITNASRTLLFNIKTLKWDEEILKVLNIPASLLPSVKDNVAEFGKLHRDFLGTEILIAGMAGDQQAATIGQACFKPGMIKATYGTGCFMLCNTGGEVIISKHQLLSTIAYRINQQTTYGLEGGIFNAGTSIKWLRDSLHLLASANESEAVAASVENTNGVYFIPAFTGLGAPYWDPAARAAILGMTRNTDRRHIVRAALESVAFQTKELLTAMHQEAGIDFKTLRVDGGMTANNWLLQFMADMLNIEVERPQCIETTALGVAYLAGLQIGIYNSLDELSEKWQSDRKFVGKFNPKKRSELFKGWKRAIKRILS